MIPLNFRKEVILGEKKKTWEVGCICNTGTLYPFKKKEKLKKICQNITVCQIWAKGSYKGIFSLFFHVGNIL